MIAVAAREDKLRSLAPISLPHPLFRLSVGPRIPPTKSHHRSLSLALSRFLWREIYIQIALSPVELSDERSFSPGDGKMHHGSSTFDGFFLDVKEGVDDMIKFLANEPSVGLFFVQQHAQTSMPYLLNLKDKVGEKIHEVTLHTEDIEDSICSVRSMAEYGIPIADEMIKDINRSLHIVSASQPKRGVIRNPSWGGQEDTSGRSIVTAPCEGSSRSSYLSAVFKSTKWKAGGLRWSQTNSMTEDPKSGNRLSSVTPPQAVGSVTPATTDTDGDELPLSSQLLDEESLYVPDTSTVLDDYDKFKSEREAKFEEWLEEAENRVSCSESGI